MVQTYYRTGSALLLAALLFLLAVSCGTSASAPPEVFTVPEELDTTVEPGGVHEHTVDDPPGPPVADAREQVRTAGPVDGLARGDELKIVFFDVGQGASALVRLPNGDDVLIDGGPREGGRDPDGLIEPPSEGFLKAMLANPQSDRVEPAVLAAMAVEADG